MLCVRLEGLVDDCGSSDMNSIERAHQDFLKDVGLYVDRYSLIVHVGAKVFIRKALYSSEFENIPARYIFEKPFIVVFEEDETDFEESIMHVWFVCVDRVDWKLFVFADDPFVELVRPVI